MHCSFGTIQHLFSSYCTSYYGCPLWNFDALDGFAAFWRKSIRRLLRLPHRTHSLYCTIVKQSRFTHPVTATICPSFLCSCYNSTNPVVSTCCTLTFNSHSIAANNLRNIMSVLNLNYETPTTLLTSNNLSNQLNRLNNRTQNHLDSSTCNSIIELIKMRD
jgi:hypothetical protein